MQAAAINAQQLARTPDGLALLLGLLDAEPAGLADFYARYHTLQVFKGLAAAAPLVLQQAILGAPLGVTRLMDMLNEQEVGAAAQPRASLHDAASDVFASILAARSPRWRGRSVLPPRGPRAARQRRPPPRAASSPARAGAAQRDDAAADAAGGGQRRHLQDRRV